MPNLIQILFSLFARFDFRSFKFTDRKDLVLILGNLPSVMATSAQACYVGKVSSLVLLGPQKVTAQRNFDRIPSRIDIQILGPSDTKHQIY